MQQDQKMMIVMLLVVMALLMSRDTHKLFAETTRTWAQFGANNYKAIAVMATAFFSVTAVTAAIYDNRLQIDANRRASDRNKEVIIASQARGEKLKEKINARLEPSERRAVALTPSVGQDGKVSVSLLARPRMADDEITKRSRKYIKEREAEERMMREEEMGNE